MELYDSEEQQVEAIKNWWSENGKAVIIGTVIGLGAILGWNYYQSSVQQAQEAASEQYSKVIDTLVADGADATDKVQSFIDGNSDTQYAVLAALQLSKAYVDADKLDNALEQLVWAKSHTDDEALTAILNYRIARIQAEQGNYSDAVTTLGAISDESWTGRVAELKGDIALRQGDRDGAYAAYTEAQQASDAGSSLQMKLDDLAK